jgi:hypothetical protein
MRKMLLQTAAAAALIAAASPALAGTWVAANPVQNSTGFSVFGINDNDVITGDYLDASGAQHGFIGPFDGSNYTSFDDPDGTTQPRALNNKGAVVGFDTGSTISFERFPKGYIKVIKRNGVPLTQVAQGITNGGVFTGNHFNKDGLSRGYLGQMAKFVSSFKLTIPNAGYAGRGITKTGDLAGWYYDPSSGLQRGFVIIGGVAQTVDYPDAVYTVGEGLNGKGMMSGQYQDASGVIHGFLYDTNSKAFTSLDAPGASLTQIWGLNDHNVVAASSDVGSFVYCVSGSGCPGADAGAVRTQHVSGKYSPALP